MSAQEQKQPRQLKPGDRLIGRPDVERLLNFSRSTIYDKLRSDTYFPRPIQTSANRIAWIESEVLAYANRLIAAANDGQEPTHEPG